MNSVLLNYYEAIEKASQDMLEAARVGNWDHVVKLEGACALLIAQLKNTAAEKPLPPDEAQLKSRIMQRILINDAEIRQLAEPWLEDLDDILAGRPEDPALTREPDDARQAAMETRPAPLDGMNHRRRARRVPRLLAARDRHAAAPAARRLGAAQPQRQRRQRLHQRDLDDRQRAAARSASTPTRPTRRCRRCSSATRPRSSATSTASSCSSTCTTWCWCTATRRAC